MKLRNTFIILLGAVVCLLAVKLSAVLLEDGFSYFRKASVYPPHNFRKLKEVRGQPLEEAWHTEPYYDLCYKKLVYEGYEYFSEFRVEPVDTGDNELIRVEITDQSYKIGFLPQVGVGSTKIAVKCSYLLSRRIIGTEKDELGFFVDGTHVTFSFTEDDKVAKIAITWGP